MIQNKRLQLASDNNGSLPIPETSKELTIKVEDDLNEQIKLLGEEQKVVNKFEKEENNVDFIVMPTSKI